MIIQSAMRGVPLVLLDAQTDDISDGIAIPVSFNHHQIIITGSTGVSAGAIQPECAVNPASVNDDDWAPIGGGPLIIIEGSQEYNWQGSYTGFRVNITTPVVGGTVTVNYIGHP